MSIFRSRRVSFFPSRYFDFLLNIENPIEIVCVDVSKILLYDCVLRYTSDSNTLYLLQNDHFYYLYYNIHMLAWKGVGNGERGDKLS